MGISPIGSNDRQHEAVDSVASGSLVSRVARMATTEQHPSAQALAGPRIVDDLDSVRLISVQDAAMLLRCHVATLYRMRERGQLRMVHVAGCTRVPLSELRRIVEGTEPRESGQ